MKNLLIRNFSLPLAVSVFVGIGASFLTMTVTVPVIETKIEFMRNSLDDVLLAVRKNQMEIVENEEWRKAIEFRINAVESVQMDIVKQTEVRYTRSEADRDYKNLIQRLDKIDREIKYLRESLQN